MKKILIASVTVFTLLVTQSCNRKVARIAESEVKDLSGRWNEIDSRVTAQELIKECHSGQWLNAFVLKNMKKPAVIVGFVKNKSHEHIDADMFMLDLEKSFINQGDIKLVQGGEKRKELRGERADQQDNASQSTMKSFGLEMGADYIMQGDIVSNVDSYKRRKTVTYKIVLQLTDLQSNEVVWFGDKQIIKEIKN